MTDPSTLLRLYRGTNIAMELEIFQETGIFMCEAARRFFCEGHEADARSLALEIHEEWIVELGGEESYARAHVDHGSELPRLHARLATLVSTTERQGVAESFAGANGTVYGADRSRASVVTEALEGSTEEEEWLYRVTTEPLAFGQVT